MNGTTRSTGRRVNGDLRLCFRRRRRLDGAGEPADRRSSQARGRQLRARVPGRRCDDAGGQRVDGQRVHDDGRRRDADDDQVHADGRTAARAAEGRRDDGGRGHANAAGGYGGPDRLGGRVGQTADVRRLRDRSADGQARRLFGPVRSGGRPARKGRRRSAGRRRRRTGTGDAFRADGRRGGAGRGTRSRYADGGERGASVRRQPCHADQRGSRHRRRRLADQRRRTGRRASGGRDHRSPEQLVPLLPGRHGNGQRRFAAGHVQDTASQTGHARAQPESVRQTGHVHQNRPGGPVPGAGAGAAARNRQRRRRSQVKTFTLVSSNGDFIRGSKSGGGVGLGRALKSKLYSKRYYCHRLFSCHSFYDGPLSSSFKNSTTRSRTILF